MLLSNTLQVHGRCPQLQLKTNANMMLSQKEHTWNDAEKQIQRRENELIGLKKMAAKNTHRKERISTLKFLLFATLKLSRDIPATLQQDHLTLLTVRPLPSINRANSILTGILVYFNSSGSFISKKLERKGGILPPWHCVWWPRWGRPGTGPGIQSGRQKTAQFLENERGGWRRVSRNHCTHFQYQTD